MGRVAIVESDSASASILVEAVQDVSHGVFFGRGTSAPLILRLRTVEGAEIIGADRYEAFVPLSSGDPSDEWVVFLVSSAISMKSASRCPLG